MFDTETLRNLSNYLLWIGLFFAACGTFGVNHFRGKLEREREAQRAESDREKAIAQAEKDRQAEARATELRDSLATVAANSEQVKERLQPFMEAASSRFPSLSQDQALEKLRTELVATRNRTEALESTVRPRTLSDSKRDQFVSRLKAAGKQHVKILRNNNDEAAFLAAQIRKRCEEAGWIVDSDEIALTSSDVGLGVFCSGDQPPPACAALVIALREEGLPAEALRSEKLLPSQTLLLRVGSKQK